jgi:hypothetical protein
MKRGKQYQNIYDQTIIEFVENITEKSGTNLRFKYIQSKHKSGELIVPLKSWTRVKENWNEIN